MSGKKTEHRWSYLSGFTWQATLLKDTDASKTFDIDLTGSTQGLDNTIIVVAVPYDSDSALAETSSTPDDPEDLATATYNLNLYGNYVNGQTPPADSDELAAFSSWMLVESQLSTTLDTGYYFKVADLPAALYRFEIVCNEGATPANICLLLAHTE